MRPSSKRITQSVTLSKHKYYKYIMSHKTQQSAIKSVSLSKHKWKQVHLEAIIAYKYT